MKIRSLLLVFLLFMTAAQGENQGTTARSLGMLDVRAYGAVCGTSADQTAKVQATVDAAEAAMEASGGSTTQTVFFPGNCTISIGGTVYVKDSNIDITGPVDGMATIRRRSPTADGPIFQFANVALVDYTVLSASGSFSASTGQIVFTGNLPLNSVSTAFYDRTNDQNYYNCATTAGSATVTGCLNAGGVVPGASDVLEGRALSNLTASNLKIYADSQTTYSSTCFKIIDVAEFTMRHVTCQLFASGGGPVKNSTALEYAGHESFRAYNVYLSASVAIHFEKNPHLSGAQYSTDGFSCHDCMLFGPSPRTGGVKPTGYTLSTEAPLILVDDQLTMSSMTFDGLQAWVGGHDALYINQPTATPVPSYQIHLSNVRWEQNYFDPTVGWFMYYNGNAATYITNLVVDNFQMSAGNHENGFYLHYVRSFSLRDAMMLSDGVQMDVADGWYISWEGVNTKTGGTIVVDSHTQQVEAVYARANGVGYELPVRALWIRGNSNGAGDWADKGGSALNFTSMGRHDMNGNVHQAIASTFANGGNTQRLPCEGSSGSSNTISTLCVLHVSFADERAAGTSSFAEYADFVLSRCQWCGPTFTVASHSGTFSTGTHTGVIVLSSGALQNGGTVQLKDITNGLLYTCTVSVDGVTINACSEVTDGSGTAPTDTDVLGVMTNGIYKAAGSSNVIALSSFSPSAGVDTIGTMPTGKVACTYKFPQFGAMVGLFCTNNSGLTLSYQATLEMKQDTLN